MGVVIVQPVHHKTVDERRFARRQRAATAEDGRTPLRQVARRSEGPVTPGLSKRRNTGADGIEH
jgi:hypothetical protein